MMNFQEQIFWGIVSGYIAGMALPCFFLLTIVDWLFTDIFRLCKGSKPMIMMIWGILYAIFTGFFADRLADLALAHPSQPLPLCALLSAIMTAAAGFTTGCFFWFDEIEKRIDRWNLERACEQFRKEFVDRREIFAVAISQNKRARLSTLVVYAASEAIFTELPNPYHGVRLRLNLAEDADLAPRHCCD
jgi:hypothetical protein